MSKQKLYRQTDGNEVVGYGYEEVSEEEIRRDEIQPLIYQKRGVPIKVRDYVASQDPSISYLIDDHTKDVLQDLTDKVNELVSVVNELKQTK